MKWFRKLFHRKPSKLDRVLVSIFELHVAGLREEQLENRKIDMMVKKIMESAK